MSQNFVVSRADLRDAHLASATPLEPAAGEVVLEIERFALTANNISYGMAGDMLGYWSFFPADEGLGRIPAWGIARVTKSAHEDVKVGDKFFGYVPMSNEVLMTPVDVSARGFSDGAAHRAQLPAIYQEYLAVTPVNGFDGKTDHRQCIQQDRLRAGLSRQQTAGHQGCWPDVSLQQGLCGESWHLRQGSCL